MRPSIPRAAAAAMLLVSAGVVSACDGPACGTYPVCDIRDAQCQAAVWVEAQCAREVTDEPIPPVRVIDVDTYRAELEADLAAHPPGPDDAHLDRALDLLDLIEMDATLTESGLEGRIANVGAYYSFRDEAITVIDRGAMDEVRDVVTLQHEMIHALQDRAHDLGAFFDAATTYDEALARSMVVEGEATTLQYVYQVGTRDLAPHDVDWVAFYDGWLGSVRRLHWSEPRFGIGAGALVYPLGARATTHAWLADPGAPRAAFDAPPTSTVSFLYDPFGGERAPVTEGTPLCEVTEIPAGTRRVIDDTFGATLLYAFLAVPGFGGEAWELARRWEGDRITVIASDDEQHTGVAWRIRVRDLEAMVQLRVRTAWFWEQPLHGVAQDGADLVLFASDDPGLFEAWSAIATRGCP